MNPGLVTHPDSDPILARMKRSGMCWYCCLGIVVGPKKEDNGPPPAVQPRTSPPAESAVGSTLEPDGDDDAGRTGPGRGQRLKPPQRKETE